MENEEYHGMAELIKEFFDEAMKNLDSRISQAQPGACVAMTVKQMAKELSISETEAYGLTKEEGFPVFRIGRCIRVNRAGLQEWMKNGGTVNDKAC